MAYALSHSVTQCRDLSVINYYIVVMDAISATRQTNVNIKPELTV